MGDRRMFSKKICESAKFIQMPQSSQNLFFHLGLNADDDGVVEAYTTMKMLGNAEDDLRILVTKGFVRILNEDLVSQIMDWNIHNQIKKDRYHESIYKDLLLMLDNQMEPNWNQIGTKMETEVKLSKDKLSKVNKRHIYQGCNYVMFTDEELEKLKNEFPNDYEEWIFKVEDYCASKGKKYKDYLATIRMWSRKEKPTINNSRLTREVEPTYDSTNNPTF